MMSRAKPPQVQVIDAIIVLLDSFTNAGRDSRASAVIQQNRGRFTHEFPSPMCNQRGTRQADQSIWAHPAISPSQRQCRDGTDRGDRVGEHMDIGGTEIVVDVAMGIATVMMVFVIVIVIMLMLMAIVVVVIVMK